VTFNQPETLGYALGNPQSQLQTIKSVYITSPELDFKRVNDTVSNYFVSNITQKANTVESFNRMRLGETENTRRLFWNNSNGTLTRSFIRTQEFPTTTNQLTLQTQPVSSDYLSTKPIDFEVNNVKLAVITNASTVYDPSVRFAVNQLDGKVYFKPQSQPTSTSILGFTSDKILVKNPTSKFKEARLKRLQLVKEKNQRLKVELSKLVEKVYKHITI
jgi:hypothetical protein